jgi:hypothetical protein
MATFERTFEGKRKSGDHQDYGIGHSRNALVDLANDISESASKCIGWDDTAADLVRDQDHLAGRRLQSGAKVFYACFEARFITPECLHKIGPEEREAVDKNGIAAISSGLNNAAQCNWFFDGGPVCWPVCAVTLDLSVHLFVIATLGCRNERDSTVPLGQLLRVAALSASDASQDEDHRTTLILLHATLPVFAS